MIAAAAAGFFAVIAKDVSARWQKRIADRIDLFLQRKEPLFERAYREFVLAGLRFIDQKGLATIGDSTPKLNEVYVDVILDPRSMPQTESGVLPGPARGPAGRHALGDFLGQQEPAVLAVVGGPGSGKTTLLRHVAQQTGERTRTTRSLSRNLPILLYLRDHVGEITASHDTSIAALVRTRLGDLRTDEPDGWLERQLHDGKCLVLLDGLDEVAQREDRKAVAAWAEGQIQRYPHNDFVISSRPQGYQAAPVGGAKILQVCGFTSAQAEALIHGWYRAIERISTGETGPDIDARARESADDLLRSLERAPALRDLTVNPLLLTMMANVHRYRAALPGSRADLYSEICQVMLWRRQDAKHLPTGLAGEKKEIVLRSLAYTMMKSRISDLNRNEVLAEVRPGLRRIARDIEPEDFLAEVSSNGLLVEREAEQYAFAHHTLQEYLAAVYIRDKGMVDVLVEAVNDEWWRETTLLYAARGDADPIVRACLQADTGPALALAFDCDEQQSDLSAELQDQLRDQMDSVWGPDCDDERRELISRVALTRHLREQRRTDGGARLCVRPITNQVYGFFLADHNPFSAGAQASVIPAGLASNCHGPAAFVQWANMISDGQTAYRLPSKIELDEFAARQPGTLPFHSDLVHAVWSQPSPSEDRGSASFWVPSDAGQPQLIDATTLSARIASDVANAVPTQFALLLHSAVGLSLLALEFVLACVHFRDLNRVADRDLDLDVNRILALDLAGSLARDLACAQTLAGNLNHAHRAHDVELGLHFNFDRVLALADDLKRAYALGLARAHDHAPIRTLDNDLYLGLDRILALDRTVGSALAQVLGSDLAFSLGLDLDLDSDSDLARDLARDYSRDLDRTLELDRDFGLDLGLGLDRNRTLNSALGLARSLNSFFGSDLAQDLDLGLIRDRDRDLHPVVLKASALTRRFISGEADSVDKETGHISSQVIGLALSRAINNSLAASSTENDWTIALPSFFAQATGVADNWSLTTDPAALAKTLAAAVDMLRSTLSGADPYGTSPWARTVADRLYDNFVPDLEGRDHISQSKMTSGRIAALCLATEADERDRRDIGEMFRQVAGGLAVLEMAKFEMAKSGEKLAVGLIMLAAD